MVFMAHNIVPETKQVIKQTGFILAWFWPKVKGEHLATSFLSES